MVDTGAGLNLVKARALHRSNRINYKDRMQISGITTEKLTTKGSATINILGHDIQLQVVSNTFPLQEEGILGTGFLGENSIINFNNNMLEWNGHSIPFYKDQITIPPRTVKTLPVNIRKTKLLQGYIPKILLGEGIYAGEAIVTNHDGQAFVKIFNTTNEEQKVSVPTLELEEVYKEISPEHGRKEEKRILKCTEISDKDRERAHKIQTLLRWDHLNPEEANHVTKLVEEHSDLFQLPGENLEGTGIISHKIPTTDNQPVHMKQYRFPPIHKEEINRQVSELLDKDIIQPSNSPYSSPLWIVPKKPDPQGNRRWRMVIDYRMLNEKTIGDAYPLPNINEILDQLGSAKYFSIFDLASGFHQIPMDKEDAPKTAFSTPYGHYQFNRMPFGLKNAPATFQRLMDQILTGLQGTELFVYLDDIVLYASSLQEHFCKFKKLADKLRMAKLRLQPNKCEFLRKEVTYLGHVINRDGVKPDPDKLTAVSNFPAPRTDRQIKQFLGLAGYYRRFIPNFSKIAKPLTELLKKGAKFQWSNDQDLSFSTLKTLLCSEPLLQYPDFTKPFVLTTDASGYAIGGILSQGPIGKDLPIAYTSRLLASAEINYSTIEKELLAIIYCVAHFRPYLYGRRFYLVTDHKPLVWLHSVKDPTSRLVRWRLKLAEYEYEVIYKAGKTNVNADALSRNPVPEPLTAEYLQNTDKLVCVAGASREPNLAENREGKDNFFNILPMHCNNNDSDSDSDLIFEPPHDTKRQKSNKDANSENSNDNLDKDSDASNEKSDDDNHSTSSSESELFESMNPTYDTNRPSFQEIRDNFSTRNDNLIIFITKTGEPCDKGARILINKHPDLDLRNHTLGRAKIIEQAKRRIIALTIKERSNQTTDVEIFRETLHSLLDVVTELEIEQISICKGDAAEMNWQDVKGYLQRVFLGTELSVMICTNQIEIPDVDKRRDIIIENHVSAIGGHKGITKTYYRIKQRYYWPQMKREIENFVNNCRDCQLKKLVRVKVRQEMILTDTPDAAFDKVSMDIMGPLPTSQNGHNYILTIQDLLTKFSLAIPLKNAGAIDVADGFVKDFICLYGTPKALLTDQGSHFINSLMKNIARRFRIRHFKTSAYRPQANGSVERSHQVLWEYLKQFVVNNDWDEHLRLATFSYNTSVHEGTKYTPHELVFGRVARVPTANPPMDEEQNESYSEYLSNLYNRLRDVQECAKENLIASKKRSKQYYDKRSRPYHFKVNDQVFLLKEPNKGKMTNQYVGPYTIIKVLPRNNVVIRISDKKTRVVHTDKLKIVKRTRVQDIPRTRYITRERNLRMQKSESHRKTRISCTSPNTDSTGFSDKNNHEQYSVNLYKRQTVRDKQYSRNGVSCKTFNRHFWEPP